jgi:hypothetical protein
MPAKSRMTVAKKGRVAMLMIGITWLHEKGGMTSGWPEMIQ